MVKKYEMTFYVKIEETECREEDGLLLPERFPFIRPVGYCAMISPQVLKDAEAMSAIFRAAEEKLIEKIQEETNEDNGCGYGHRNCGAKMEE